MDCAVDGCTIGSLNGLVYDRNVKSITKISVIVPVYNSEKWLKGCVSSICKQSYQDIEIVLVDDCSTDASFSICEALAQEDSRVKTIRNSVNSGANITRRNGVKASCGDYIMFVDSDDSIPQDCISNLSRFIPSSDIIIGVKWDTHERNKVFSAEQWRNQCAEGGLLMSPIAKLYRRSLFDDSVFDIPSHIRVCEDDIMNLRLSIRNQKDVILFLERKCYNYNQNDGSVTSKWKWDVDRFSQLYDVVRDSIPVDQIGARMNSLIDRRLTSLRVLYEASLAVSDIKSFKSSEYIIHLKEDIYKTGRQIPWGLRFVLSHPSSILAFWYYKIKRILLILSQKIQRIIHG